MPNPVYSDILTTASAGRLADLVRDLPHPVALAGGHAVRLRVRDAWLDAFGQEYFGSRDIDLIYYVDPDWTTEEFRMSAAGQAPQRIKQLGYKPLQSFRFGIILDAKGNALDREPPLPAIREIDYDTLCLDPMVTHKREDAREVMGFEPVDEPILAPIFKKEWMRTPLPELGVNVYLPTAPVLVATKLNSLPGRQKGDKSIKDLCDLYALVAYGGEKTAEVRRVIYEFLPTARDLVDAALGNPYLADAVAHLDVPEADFRAVIGPLALPP